MLTLNSLYQKKTWRNTQEVEGHLSVPDRNTVAPVNCYKQSTGLFTKRIYPLQRSVAHLGLETFTNQNLTPFLWRNTQEVEGAPLLRE